jgi:predicted TPR repeat methyltransferase
MGKLKVMDLGCGTGLVGPLIRDLCRELAGVDLSPRMIAMARDKGVYDRLIVGDVVEPLTASPASYDAVIAADVFVYIGNLDAVFGASREALVGGGYFVFSTETEQGEGEYLLRESGRYAHTDSYVQYLSGKYGFKMLHSENVVLRKEGGSAIQGTLYVLECGG